MSRSYTGTTSSVHIILAVGNMPSGKRQTSRTISATPLQSILLEESLHSRQSFWYDTDKSIQRIPQPEKRLRDERYQYQEHSASLKTYECSRHRRCSMLKIGDNVNHSHSDRCQPLMTVKHERRNVVLRSGAAE